MSEKICRWIKDEICVNDQCPMCADYCPTAQYHGVCKYEELVVDETSLTPKECLRKAFSDQGYQIGDVSDFDTDQIINKFLKFMTECGHVQEISVRYNINGENENNKKHNEEFVVGKQVHVGAIGASKDWEYVGEQNGRDIYQTKDKQLIVSFNKYDDSVWGTVMLNRAAVNTDNSQNVEFSNTLKEGDEVRIMDLYGNADWQEVFCKDNIAEFRSKDGTLGCTFTEESTTAIIYHR